MLIKWGLADIAPLPFAGLRYALAALLLSPIMFTPANRRALAGCGRREWGLLIAFGLLQYGVTQAAQFLALSYLPATTLSLMLAFTPAVVALLGVVVLGERIGWREMLGITAFLGGAGLFFAAEDLPSGATIGLVIGAVGVLANTALAFWLWNRAQAVLSALEASLINNTMLIQIAVLAVLFLGERLTAMQVAGLTLAGAGVLFVQLARMRAARLIQRVR